MGHEEEKTGKIPNLQELLDSGVSAYDTEDDDLATQCRVLVNAESGALNEGEVFFIGNSPYVSSGWYDHFKGGRYYVFGVTFNHVGEQGVLYHHVTEDNPGGLWLRPINSFLGVKEQEGGDPVKRFVKVESET